MLVEVRIVKLVGLLGEGRGLVPVRDHEWGESGHGVPVMICFFILVLNTEVCLACAASGGCIFIICAFVYVYYT